MSEILGFGENQYRLYENGDMPSEANGKVLMSIMNPEIFLTFVLNAREQFSEDEDHYIRYYGRGSSYTVAAFLCGCKAVIRRGSWGLGGP